MIIKASPYLLNYFFYYLNVPLLLERKFQSLCYGITTHRVRLNRLNSVTNQKAFDGTFYIKLKRFWILPESPINIAPGQGIQRKP